VGVQPRVDTFGMRKTAHVFGAIALHDASFTFRFAPVFNGHTFHEFLMQLVNRYAPRKVFAIIDNGPCHWLDEAGKTWLAMNKHRIELHRLPPYSPEYNPTEGVAEALDEGARRGRGQGSRPPDVRAGVPPERHPDVPATEHVALNERPSAAPAPPTTKSAGDLITTITRLASTRIDREHLGLDFETQRRSKQAPDHRSTKLHDRVASVMSMKARTLAETSRDAA
jgi:hypothetical protein